VAKVLVSINDSLLRRIDRVAQARGLTRSAFLAQLAQRELDRLAGPGKSSAARAALARLDELIATTPSGDSTELIRAERDAR
jgi:hypothetical protein